MKERMMREEKKKKKTWKRMKERGLRRRCFSY
jgi:hypothetical protein